MDHIKELFDSAVDWARAAWADPARRKLALTVGSYVLVFVLGLWAGVAWSAPGVTLTATPASADGSATPVLTWTSTDVASCQASGGWSGTKATSGTETLPAIVTTTNFGLTCSASGGSARLTWTPPTTKTDGSPLTNLAQYGIHVGTAAASVVWRENIPAPATSYTITGLPAGPHWFGMTAIDANGVSSFMSSLVTREITVGSASANTTVQVRPLPNPPTLLTVTTLAYELRLYSNGTLRFVQVWTVPLGAACGPLLAGDYAIFDGATLSKQTTGGIIAARCG